MLSWNLTKKKKKKADNTEYLLKKKHYRKIQGHVCPNR